MLFKLVRNLFCRSKRDYCIKECKPYIDGSDRFVYLKGISTIKDSAEIFTIMCIKNNKKYKYSKFVRWLLLIDGITVEDCIDGNYISARVKSDNKKQIEVIINSNGYVPLQEYFRLATKIEDYLLKMLNTVYS